MPRVRVRSKVMIGGVLGVLALSTLAGAQPQPERRRPPEATEGGPLREMTVERMRMRLAGSLENTREEIKTLKSREENLASALARLDSGASVREVFAALREAEAGKPPRPEGEGDRPGRGDRPGGDDEMSRPARPGPLSPEERRRILAAVAKEFPELHGRLRQVEADSPGEVERLVMRLAPRIREFEDLRERDPAMARIRLREMKASLRFVFASREWRNAVATGEAGAERLEVIRTDVRESLAEMFDARSDAQQLDLDRLKERMARLEAELSDRRTNRDALLEEQIERMNPMMRLDRPEQGEPGGPRPPPGN